MRSAESNVVNDKIRSFVAASSMFLFAGCVRVQDEYHCFLQPQSTLNEKRADYVAAPAPDSFLRSPSYLDGHRTVEGNGQVLYVEKIRFVREWGLPPSGKHEYGESTQVSIELPQMDYQTLNQQNLSLDGRKVFVSKWQSGFGIRGVPMPGETVFPVSSDSLEIGGLIKIKGTVWNGEILITPKSTRFDGKGVEDQVKRIRFSCAPKLIESKKVESCLGQVWFKCGGREGIVSSVESKYEFCPTGFEKCHERHDSPISQLGYPGTDVRSNSN